MFRFSYKHVYGIGEWLTFWFVGFGYRYWLTNLFIQNVEYPFAEFFSDWCACEEDVEYKMRMTQDLKDKIVESAKEHNRSMNADIVARLEESFLRNESSAPARSDVKIIHLKNGKKRIIYGKLINNLSLTRILLKPIFP